MKQFELLCCLYSVDHVDPFGAATQLQLVYCCLLLFIVVYCLLLFIVYCCLFLFVVYCLFYFRELMEKDVLRRKDNKDAEIDIHSKVINN